MPLPVALVISACLHARNLRQEHGDLRLKLLDGKRTSLVRLGRSDPEIERCTRYRTEVPDGCEVSDFSFSGVACGELVELVEEVESVALGAASSLSVGRGDSF